MEMIMLKPHNAQNNEGRRYLACHWLRLMRNVLQPSPEPINALILPLPGFMGQGFDALALGAFDAAGLLTHSSLQTDADPLFPVDVISLRDRAIELACLIAANEDNFNSMGLRDTPAFLCKIMGLTVDEVEDMRQ